jgi:RNA 3'-terminal phosphate cyclase (ATP)
MGMNGPPREALIELDGALGEGGGQVLRTSLTLSIITGQPFRIVNIRANRAKPGLMRQHLVAVQAAATVSDAVVTGAEVGSQTLAFEPRGLHGGDYDFAIGTAGSCTLVLQTLILALLHAERPSTIRISGGTHNPLAPPAHFLQRAYCPLLARMGARASVELERFGFYPAGGGVLSAAIEPRSAWIPLDLPERGQLRASLAEAFVAGIPRHVAERELETIAGTMSLAPSQLALRVLPREQGRGNAVLLTFEHEYVTEVFAGFGEKTVDAPAVAMQAVHEARQYLASQAAAGEHLADQLMLPLALAGAGRYTASTISQHALTNADVIARFLPVRFSFTPERVANATAGRHVVTVTPAR